MTITSTFTTSASSLCSWSGGGAARASTISRFHGDAVCPETAPGTPHHAAQGSADTVRLAHLAEAEARLLVLLERLAERLLAEPATPLLLALLALLALLPLVALLAVLALLEQRHDRGRQRLLHGLFHSVLNACVQRAVQRESQVRVRLLGQSLLLELLLDLLDLLERLLQLLRDLLARLLTRLLDRLLDHLGDLLRAAHLLAELLLGLSTGHHRHECSVRCHHRKADIKILCRFVGIPDDLKLRGVRPHRNPTTASRGGIPIDRRPGSRAADRDVLGASCPTCVGRRRGA
ncbi:hypothetical protein [Streptomyces mirabilis]|uniref:hypothetical protein n=1 Tax=Streptomyces mirabilis TaxID=68239 RepID=UPI0036A9CE09